MNLNNKFFLRELEHSFVSDYRNINRLVYWFGWIGNILDIGLVFSFIFEIMLKLTQVSSISGKFLYGLFIGLIIFGVEVFKRASIDELFMTYFTDKKSIKFKILIIWVSCILLITGYMAISGSRDLFFKKIEVTQVIDQSADLDIKKIEQEKKEELAKLDEEYKPLLKKFEKEWGDKKDYQKTLEDKNSQKQKIEETYNLRINSITIKTNNTKQIHIESGEDDLIKALFVSLFIEFIIFACIFFNVKYMNEEYKMIKKQKLIEEESKQTKIKEIKESAEYIRFLDEYNLLLAIYKSNYTGIGTYLKPYSSIKDSLKYNLKTELPGKRQFDSIIENFRRLGIFYSDRGRAKFIKELNDAKQILLNDYAYTEDILI